MWAKQGIAVSSNRDNTMLTWPTKILWSSVKLESKHAVENMLHWLVRIIFCYNWTQIPQYDSWASALVTTLVQSFSHLLLQIIANRQSYFFWNIWCRTEKTKLCGSHRVRVSQQKCFGLDFENESSWITSLQTHVTATAVGWRFTDLYVDTQAKEIHQILSCGVWTDCKVRC